MRYYTASKSRNQGRESWSVIFRHPARLDLTTGKTGRRVRRGLGTNDETEATLLVEQLNTILSTPELWEVTARPNALGRFDGRVVDIFYDGLESSQVDFVQLRQDALPLPSDDDGYRTVLLLGTTGAGKTTVVRQILGTDPTTERFPSTSTAKTTVADTELITTEDSSYRAVVTFVPRDEVIDYLTENVSEAALAVLRKRSEDEIRRRLLDHVNQRFRFSYVLGRGVVKDDDLDLADDDEEEFADIDPADYGSVDLTATNTVVAAAVEAVKSVVERHSSATAEAFKEIEDDERVVEELIEESLDSDLRQSGEFHAIVDSLIDEIEKRFSTLEVGELRRNRQGWPITWSWESDDRAAFLKMVTRFSSNFAPLFGRLLTPLVNGLRVSGPFQPGWASEPVHLVLVDGEGLGHTPKSVAALSTHVATQLQNVDAIVLVDNAAQPMQAAPVAALKGIAVSGNAGKLHVVFTHFDQVKGPNVPTFGDREQHVLASVENVLKSIGDELGPAAERVLHRRIDQARFFVGGIQGQLDAKKQAGSRTIDQLDAFLTLLAHPERATETGPSRPVFNRMNLSLAVMEAAKTFHTRWRGTLGLDNNPDASKAHWTRIKALTRRLATEGWADEYDDLKPVAELRYYLQTQILLMLQRPERWSGDEPGENEKQAILDALLNSVTNRLVELTQRRLRDEVRRGWQNAYLQKGPGSTFVRARIIASEVYERGAPIPTVTASPDQNRFLRDVAEAVDEVVREFGGDLE